MWKFIVLVTLIGVMGACETEDGGDPSPEREACVDMCALVACLGDVTSDQVSACADRCMEKRDDAQQRGAMCEAGYTRSVDCFAGLSCEQYLAWEGGDKTICEAPLQAFDNDCGDLTFEFGP